MGYLLVVYIPHSIHPRGERITLEIPMISHAKIKSEKTNSALVHVELWRNPVSKH